MTHPTGTVTFLFTDIEGSAKLAQHHPAALPTLLARHHAILHESIARHNGHVFQIVGDAFCAAFSTAGDALGAALDVQRGLQHEAWYPASITVREGLHTGTAQAGASEERAGGYAGYLTMTRVQRVISVAHGGQVLLSNATAELLRGQLSDDVTLRDLGEHRLKGLLNLEHLWQMVAPDLRQDFPALPTLNAIPNNLPVQLTSFIGREREIAEVAHLLTTARLVTLTGSGGAGKTRLSLEIAAEVLDTFKDGVWFVELAPLSNPSLISYAVANVLGVREEQGRPVMEALLNTLRSKQLLLILDNCEHLIEGCAHFADSVLHAGREMRILASSREALGIAGELPWRVPSLATPNPKESMPIGQLEQYAAVRLFIARATVAQPTFRVTTANAPALAQICYRLDGNPLAIELAAARVKVLSVEQIAARLDDRFRLLTGGGRTALPRHQTLRALIDWSYSLLTKTERILFRQLAVFVGDWTLEAAEAVCAGEDIDTLDILDLLAHLVDKSLVAIDLLESETRYRMLETIRDCAFDKLREAGEEESIRSRHFGYFLAIAAPPIRPSSSERVTWLDRMELDHDNLRASLRWSLERNESEQALALCNILSGFWNYRGYWTESRMRYRQAIAASRQLQAYHQVSHTHRAEYGKALDQSGSVATVQGDYATAQSQLEEALAVKRDLGDTAGVASVLINLGDTAWYQDDGQGAKTFWSDSLALYRELGDKSNIAYMLWRLGMLAKEQGAYSKIIGCNPRREQAHRQD